MSRPNTVMNQGMPAAKSGRRNSPVRMRSAARSAIERSNARRRLSQPPRTRGTRSVQAATTSPSVSRSSLRCSASSASVSGSSEGTTSTVRSQRSWGSSESSNVAPPSWIRPCCERTIRVLRSPARVHDQDLAAAFVVGRRRGRREVRRILGIAEREVVELDGDDVREVRGELERDLEIEPVHALVADRDPLLHARADEALPGDRERVLRKPVQARVAEEERRCKVLDAAGRQQKQRRSLHGEHEPREKPRVVREEAARRARRCPLARPTCRRSTLRGS